MPGEVLTILRMTSRVAQRRSLGGWEISPKCPIPFPGLKDQLYKGGGEQEARSYMLLPQKGLMMGFPVSN